MFEEEDKETGYVVFIAITLAIVISLFVIAIAIGSAIGQAGRKPGVAAVELPSIVQVIGRIYFEVGKADMPQDAMILLRPAMRLVHARPTTKLVISGYHDASGDAAANAELAKRRAFAVREALLAAGLNEKQIELAKPVLTMGGDDAAEARRVDVTAR